MQEQIYDELLDLDEPAVRCPVCLDRYAMAGPGNFFNHIREAHPSDPMGSRLEQWLKQPDHSAPRWGAA